MTLKDHILDIRQSIKNEQFDNEAAVSQGIVLRLLGALGWPIHNTRRVRPQYRSYSGAKPVDYALCNEDHISIAIIEVKRLNGATLKSQTQLDEYAVETDVSLALLTDGREWKFCLPLDLSGKRDEEWAYHLNIESQDLEECVLRLSRYLAFSSVVSGESLTALRRDRSGPQGQEIIRQSLARALTLVLEMEQEDALVLGVGQQVSKLSGYWPDDKVVIDFVRKNLSYRVEGCPKAE